jgi:DNA-binding beta-propeller fold protein YncE
VYVSAWGGNEVYRFRPAAAGRLAPAGVIPVARHPSAMLLNPSASRLFVASGSTDRVSVVATPTGRVITELFDPAPAGPAEGSTERPALSDGRTRPS